MTISPRLAHLAPPSRRHRAPWRAIAAAFGSGAAVALVASTGIAFERMTHGDARLALVANGLTALTSVAVLVVTALAFGALATHARAPRVAPLAVLVPQGLGAVFAIAVVHAVLRASPLALARGLSEAPAQLVNDAVAAFAILTFVWSCARRTVRASAFALALASIAVYSATAARWHLDAFTVGFARVGVQQFVAAECVAVGVALLLFRAFARPSR